LQYTEAGAGIGIVPESVLPLDPSLPRRPRTPHHTIPLVMVWSKDGDDPAVIAFRSLIESHLQAQTLWPHL
jgi:DNA-binding transcriptional LysR family regulator